jgi:hypothetical protein
MNASSPRQQRCRESLRQRARQDRFLGTADQKPQLERLLAELDAVLRQDEADAGQRLTDLTRDISQRAEALADTLREIRAPLESVLARLQQDSSPAAVDAAAAALTTAGSSLARRLRHRLLHLLDDAAPAHKHVPELLATVTAGRRTAVETLPESLFVIHARRTGIAPCTGQPLSAQSIDPQLETLCHRPWLARWRLRRLRRRLHRQYQRVEIDPREVLVDTLLRRTDINPAALLQRHSDTHATLETQLNDAWRALRYAIDTALVELGDLRPPSTGEPSTLLSAKSADLATLVQDAFDKTLAALRDSGDVYATILQGMIAELAQDREHAFAAARDALASAHSATARLHYAWSTLRKTMRRRIRQGAERSMAALPLAERLFQQLRRRGEHVWLQLKDLLRLGEAPEESTLAIADLPTELDLAERLHALPPIYRRLYSADPLLNREFLVGRDDELRMLADAYKRWQTNRATNIAIVGGEGSGKSSLINCFENEIAEESAVIHIDLNERLRTEADVIRTFSTQLDASATPQSVAELAQALLAGPRRIVVVHRTHNMYLRTVGGSAAPRAFFRLMLATRAHLMWLTSFRLYPWRRLDYLFDAGRYYTRVLTTELHNEVELREAIMRRQRTTGDALVFADPPASIRLIRKLRLRHELDSPIVQRALADRYFEALFRVSGGNLESAFYFWLLSLRAESPQQLTVLPTLTPDDRLIRNLDRLDHFALAELVGHGHLTAAEHAEIFRIEPSYSQLILDNLVQLRVVERNGADGGGQAARYGISAVFQQTVVGVLTDLNTLY